MDIFKECYEKRKELLKKSIQDYKFESGVTPVLTVIRHKENSQESESYVKSKKKIADELGVVIDEVFVGDIREAQWLLRELTNPFIIQMPFGYAEKIDDIRKAIDRAIEYPWSLATTNKDADGLSSTQKALLSNGCSYCNQPATAKGVMWYLEYIYGNKLSGKTVTIVNRSELIGKPLIQLCLQKDMGVNIRHSKCTPDGFDTDIVITGTGGRLVYDEYDIGHYSTEESPIVETIIDCSMARFKGVDGVGDWDKESVQDAFPEINIASGYGYTGLMTCLALIDNVLNYYTDKRGSVECENC